MRPTDRARGAVLAAAMLSACSGANTQSGDICRPDDADGVVGGDFALEVTVDEGGFSPAILAAQNLAHVARG
jgi:hypothetical protein